MFPLGRVLSDKLNKEKALIFRITHVRNVDWILENGLPASSSAHKDPNFVSIGNEEIIRRRKRRSVPIGPGGTLDDYVPFYFTPFSIMMFNIHTGHGNIVRRSNDELVMLVSSLYQLQDLGVRFVFTDRHAYLQTAEFYEDVGSIGEIDWDLLRRRDFANDPADPGKKERYQAEALVYRHVPVDRVGSSHDRVR